MRHFRRGIGNLKITNDLRAENSNILNLRIHLFGKVDWTTQKEESVNLQTEQQKNIQTETK